MVKSDELISFLNEKIEDKDKGLHDQKIKEMYYTDTSSNSSTDFF